MSITSIVGYFSNVTDTGSVCYIDAGFLYISNIDATPMNKDSVQAFSVEVPSDVTQEQTWAINNITDNFFLWGEKLDRSLEMRFLQKQGNIATGFRTYSPTGTYLEALYDSENSRWSITGEFGWSIVKQSPVIGGSAAQAIYCLDNRRLVYENTQSLLFSDDNGKTWATKPITNRSGNIAPQAIAPVKIGDTWVLLASVLLGDQIMYTSEDNGETWQFLPFSDPTKPSVAAWTRDSIIASNGDYALFWSPHTSSLYTFIVGEYLTTTYFPNEVKEIYFDSVSDKWWIVGAGGTRYWASANDPTQIILDSNYSLPAILVDNFDTGIITPSNDGGALFNYSGRWELQSLMLPENTVVQDANYSNGELLVVGRTWNQIPNQLSITKYDGTESSTVFTTPNINISPDGDYALLYNATSEYLLIRNLDSPIASRIRIDIQNLDDNYDLKNSYRLPNLPNSTLINSKKESCIVASVEDNSTIAYEYNDNEWRLISAPDSFSRLEKNTQELVSLFLNKPIIYSDGWKITKNNDLNQSNILDICTTDLYTVACYSGGIQVRINTSHFVETYALPVGSSGASRIAVKGNKCYVLSGNAVVLIFDLLDKTWETLTTSQRFFTTTSFTYYSEDNVFIRTALGGILEFSFDDCVTWQSINQGSNLSTQANTSASLNSTSYDGSQYFAYGNGGLILKSSDAKNWYVENLGVWPIQKTKKVNNRVFGFVSQIAMLVEFITDEWKVVFQIPTLGNTSTYRAPRDIAFNGTDYIITASARGNLEQNRVVYVTSDFESFTEFRYSQSGNDYPETFGACEWFKGYWYIAGGYGTVQETFSRGGIVRTQDFETWELVYPRSSTPTFFAFATDGNVLTSSGSTLVTSLYTEDGEVWESISTPSWVAGTNIKYLNGLFVISLNNNRAIRYSTDGKTFVNGAITPVGVLSITDFDYDPVNDLWMAITQVENNTNVLYGDVTTSWTVNSDDTSGTGTFCFYLNNNFYLGKGNPNTFATTVDGSSISWSTPTTVTENLFGGYHDASWLIYSQDTIYENDGTLWDSFSTPAPMVVSDSLVVHNGKYFLSANNLLWEADNLNDFSVAVDNIGGNFISVSHDSSIVLAADNTESVRYSLNRKTWQSSVVNGKEINTVYVFNSTAISIDSDNEIYLSTDINSGWVSSIVLDSSVESITNTDTTLVIKTKDSIYKTTNMTDWDIYSLNHSIPELNSMYSNENILVGVGNGYMGVSEDSGQTWQIKEIACFGKFVTYLNGTWVFIGSNNGNLVVATSTDLENFDTKSYGRDYLTAYSRNGSLFFVNDFLAEFSNDEIFILNKLNTVCIIVPELDDSKQFGNLYARSLCISKKEANLEKLVPLNIDLGTSLGGITGNTNNMVVADGSVSFIFRTDSGYRIAYSYDLENWEINPSIFPTTSTSKPLLFNADGKWVTAFSSSSGIMLAVFEDISSTYTEVLLDDTGIVSGRIPISAAYFNGAWVFTTESTTMYLVSNNFSEIEIRTDTFTGFNNIVNADANGFVAFRNGDFLRSIDGKIWNLEYSLGTTVFGTSLYVRENNILLVTNAAVSSRPETFYSPDNGNTWQSFNTTLSNNLVFGYLFDTLAHLEVSGISYDMVTKEIIVNGNFNDIVGMGFNANDREATLFINGQQILKATVFVGSLYPVIFAVAKSSDVGASASGRFISNSNDYSYQYDDYPNNICGDEIVLP